MFQLDETSALWQHQQNLINYLIAGKTNATTDCPVDYKAVRGSIWARVSELISPCNMVIRNLCILDLIEGTRHRAERIFSQVTDIRGVYFPWLEGYSYWSQDTRPIYQIWCNKFATQLEIEQNYNQIEEEWCFQSYKRADGALYPVPVGDITDIPLDHETLRFVDANSGQISTGIVTPELVGLNLHAPETTYRWYFDPVEQTMMIKGLGATTYTQFGYYTTITNKYPGIFGEELDELKRIGMLIKHKITGKC